MRGGVWSALKWATPEEKVRTTVYTLTVRNLRDEQKNSRPKKQHTKQNRTRRNRTTRTAHLVQLGLLQDHPSASILDDSLERTCNVEKAAVAAALKKRYTTELAKMQSCWCYSSTKYTTACKNAKLVAYSVKAYPYDLTSRPPRIFSKY